MRDPHTPRKRGPATPEGKEKSLANLIQNQEQAQLVEIEQGKRQRVQLDRDTHGVHSSAIELQPQTRAIAEQINAIVAGDSAGFIKPCDRITVNLLATNLRRIQQAEAYLDKVGSLTNKRGAIRPVAELLIKLLREAREFCNVLGLTPAARAKLGADVSNTFNHMSAADTENMKELLDDPELRQAVIDSFRRSYQAPQK